MNIFYYSNDSVNDIEFSTSRIRKILKDVNVNKAAGPDGIHSKILKNCRDSIAYPLSSLFKNSYNIGQIPSEWKLANVVPVQRSCTTQMDGYIDCLSLSINDNIRTDVVNFDFAKAFNHDVILKKLKSEFEIDGTLLKFIMNFLKDRKQCVIIRGSHSEHKNVQSGVPQDSILGPLFLYSLLMTCQNA